MIDCGIRFGRYWVAIPTTIQTTTPVVTSGEALTPVVEQAA